MNIISYYHEDTKDFGVYIHENLALGNDFKPECHKNIKLAVTPDEELAQGFISGFMMALGVINKKLVDLEITEGGVK